MSCTEAEDGAGDRSRTYDLRVTSALLYRLSYTGVLMKLTLRSRGRQSWAVECNDTLRPESRLKMSALVFEKRGVPSLLIGEVAHRNGDQ